MIYPIRKWGGNMPNTKKLSVRDKTMRRKKPGSAGIAKRMVAYRGEYEPKGLCAASNTLGDLRVTIRGMGLDELLSVSDYISRYAHGEQPSLSANMTAQSRKCIRIISEMPSDNEKSRAIAMLNTQIVAKNRASVNMQSAERAYAEFIRTD